MIELRLHAGFVRLIIEKDTDEAVPGFVLYLQLLLLSYQFLP